jgi:hypothetical protein
LQSESHPIDFRKVELLNLAGCMDKAASNYKSYYVKPVPEDCKFAEGAKPAMRRPGDYPVSAEALPQEGIPKGHLEGPFEFRSKVIEGTVRRYWIFVPAQYNPKKPANVLVFQDGQRATNPNGPLRLPTVMENLIGKGKLPVTIGIFITPGNLSDTYPDNLGFSNPNHRKEEYDALNDNYARFLIEEMLPEVGKKYNLTDDPEKRAIGGTSSGAICAFTVAWQRPDMFRRVISMIGSYTSIGYQPASDGKPMIPGGDLYPTLIRKNLHQTHPDLSTGREKDFPTSTGAGSGEPADALGVRICERQGRQGRHAGRAVRGEAQLGRRRAFDAHGGALLSRHPHLDLEQRLT